MIYFLLGFLSFPVLIVLLYALENVIERFRPTPLYKSYRHQEWARQHYEV